MLNEGEPNMICHCFQVTAVTVAPDFRRQHLAQKLMQMLEDVTEKVVLVWPAYYLQLQAYLRICTGCQVHDGYFVDLFVRKSNSVAISMYEKFGYIKYREVSISLVSSAGY